MMSSASPGTRIPLVRVNLLRRDETLSRAVWNPSAGWEVLVEGTDEKTLYRPRPGDAREDLLGSSADHACAGRPVMTREAVLTELNREIARPDLVRLGAATICATAIAAGLYVAGTRLVSPLLSLAVSVLAYAVLCWLAGGLVKSLVWKKRVREGVTFLFYRLGEDAFVSHAKITKAFQQLSFARVGWVEAEAPEGDPAGRSVRPLRALKFGRLAPPGIATNLTVCGFDFGSRKLFFMPDCLFVLEGRKYRAVPYHLCGVEVSHTGLAARGVLLVPFAILKLDVPEWTGLELQVTPVQRAADFEATLHRALERFGGRWTGARKAKNIEGARSRPEPEEETPPVERGVDRPTACEILGVSAEASREEVYSAYRRKAKMYHPDKVESLGDEFSRLAEERMKEINAAYAVLKGE